MYGGYHLLLFCRASPFQSFTDRGGKVVVYERDARGNFNLG